MKDRILNILKQRNDYVSGQELADTLGVSRTAVWKAVTALKNDGYNITSVSRLGYLLDTSCDILNKWEIDFTDDFYFEDEVTSTSDLAKKFAAEGKKEFFFVTCNRQTAGKGRLGRTWSSPRGMNIYLSMIFYPDTDIRDVAQITPVMGIAAARTIEQVTGLDAGIKWPNDIIINGRKAAGILTEMQAEVERILFVVAGIGINVNQTVFDGEIAKKATSLRLESGRIYKRAEIIKKLAENIKKYYGIFIKSGFPALKDEYKTLCINLGREVCATYRGERVTGTAADISDRGELIIKTDSGFVPISGGEASLRNINNEYI